MPDIDIDFAADRREEVIQYIYEQYGRGARGHGLQRGHLSRPLCAARRGQGAGLSARRDRPGRQGAGHTHPPPSAAEQIAIARASLDEEDAGPLPWDMLAAVLAKMEGVPRHLSIHVGGMLITAAPLVEVVPLERAAMPDRVVVQWDKDSVEDAGLIKIDLLSLRTLGAVEEALAHIRAGVGHRSGPGPPAAGRSGRLCAAAAGGHDRLLSGRKPRPGADAAPAAADLL